jgi:hypothetical protein
VEGLQVGDAVRVANGKGTGYNHHMKLSIAVLLFVLSSLVYSQEQKAEQRTGRFKNLLVMDTLGCRSVPLLEKALTEMFNRRPIPPGCYALNEDEKGLPVIGPLQVYNPNPSKSCGTRGNVCWARIEVSGRGNLWTFLEHLKDKHGK